MVTGRGIFICSPEYLLESHEEDLGQLEDGNDDDSEYNDDNNLVSIANLRFHPWD